MVCYLWRAWSFGFFASYIHAIYTTCSHEASHHMALYHYRNAWKHMMLFQVIPATAANSVWHFRLFQAYTTNPAMDGHSAGCEYQVKRRIENWNQSLKRLEWHFILFQAYTKQTLHQSDDDAFKGKVVRTSSRHSEKRRIVVKSVGLLPEPCGSSVLELIPVSVALSN